MEERCQAVTAGVQIEGQDLGVLLETQLPPYSVPISQLEKEHELLPVLLPGRASPGIPASHPLENENGVQDCPFRPTPYQEPGSRHSSRLHVAEETWVGP